MRSYLLSTLLVCAIPLFFFGLTVSVRADQVIADDLIVDGSSCVGFDCVNGEAFGFDTIRLKENNVRIQFDDTSSTASFPTNNWQLRANASGNGGPSFFGIVDQGASGNSDSGTIVFQVEAGARANALFVEADGDVGIGTGNPTVDLHIVTGNTPTVRLDQDGSSGFTPQVWDVAGNETNFFVRDVTGGSRLPLRIRPSAPTSSIDVAGTSGNVGFGTSSPGASVHVRRTDASAQVKVEETNGTFVARQLLLLTNNGGAQARFENTNNGSQWNTGSNNGGGFQINRVGSGITEFSINGANGNVNMGANLLVTGTISSGGMVLNVPDYVFDPDYKLTPLSELADFIAEKKHLPNIPSAAEVKEAGQVNLSEFQMKLLQKIEELTLYTIDQQKTIDRQIEQIDRQKNTIEDFKTRLDKLESKVN